MPPVVKEQLRVVCRPAQIYSSWFITAQVLRAVFAYAHCPICPSCCDTRRYDTERDTKQIV